MCHKQELECFPFVSNKFHKILVKCVHLRSSLKLTHSVPTWAIVLTVSHTPLLPSVHKLVHREAREHQR